MPASLKMDHHHLQLGAVGAAISLAQVAPAYGLGGSPVGSFSIPFHPFEIKPFQADHSFHADQSAEGNMSCVTKSMSRITKCK